MSALLFLQQGIVMAGDPAPRIARITSVFDRLDSLRRSGKLDPEHWMMRIIGKDGLREATVGGILRQGEILQTVSTQHAELLLEDGTEIFVGPSSLVRFSNWYERDGNNRRVRRIELRSGLMKVKLKKIYSFDEPFLIENKYGVVRARGVEFVVEAGSGGKLEHSRQYSTRERVIREQEVELHALEGEFDLAPQVEDFGDKYRSVLVRSGQTSLVRLNMRKPTTPHAFNILKFQDYLAHAAPGVKFAVANNAASNNARASVAMNAPGESEIASVSPAQPKYARVYGPPNASRSIASVPTTSPSTERFRGAPSVSYYAGKSEPTRIGKEGESQVLKDAFTGGEKAKKVQTNPVAQLSYDQRYMNGGRNYFNGMKFNEGLKKGLLPK